MSSEMNSVNLNVRSKLSHPSFMDKTFMKYLLQGRHVIGVFGDEPFTIVVSSDGGVRLQFSIAIDGMDIRSGNPFTGNFADATFVMESYATTSILKGYPKDRLAGDQFVFTQKNYGVSQQILGDNAELGVIQVAVWYESAPLDSSYNPRYTPEVTRPRFDTGRYDLGLDRSGTERTRSEESFVAATGAGARISQRLGVAEPLSKPRFMGVLELRYMWYNEMVAALKLSSPASPPQVQPPGFIDLTQVRRVPGTSQPFDVDIYPRMRPW